MNFITSLIPDSKLMNEWICVISSVHGFTIILKCGKFSNELQVTRMCVQTFAGCQNVICNADNASDSLKTTGLTPVWQPCIGGAACVCTSSYMRAKYKWGRKISR